jgi:hypothetical protein
MASFAPTPSAINQVPIKERIERLREAQKLQAETASALAEAEYNDRQMLELVKDLSWAVTQSINSLLDNNYTADTVMIGESLFVRTAVEGDGGIGHWEWVLKEIRHIELPTEF